MKTTSAVSLFLFFASQSSGLWTTSTSDGAGATSPILKSNAAPSTTQLVSKRAISPDKWCKGQRGITLVIASSSIAGTTVIGSSTASSMAVISTSTITPSLITKSLQSSFANSTFTVGLITVSSTTTSTSTLTTTVTRSLPSSLSPPVTASTRHPTFSPTPISSSMSAVSSAPSQRPASTILVLGGPHSTLTLTNSDLSISTAIDHVPYVLSTYVTGNISKTSVLGPLISTCMPTTTVTAAGINGSATVTFAQGGTGIGPMVTPSVAQQNSKREYVEESIFASWTMVEPQTVTNQPSVSTAPSLQSQRKSARSDPLILRPTGNAAENVKPPAKSTLLILLGLYLLLNTVAATSSPAPNTPAQVSEPAKTILPFYCQYSTQGYLMDGTIHTFSWVPACPTGYVITDYGNSAFELTSTSYPSYLKTKTMATAPVISSPHMSGALKRGISTPCLEAHAAGHSSEHQIKVRKKGGGGGSSTSDQTKATVPHMLLLGVFLLILLSCFVPSAIGDGRVDESMATRSAEEATINLNSQRRLEARKGSTGGKSIKVKSSKRKDNSTGATSHQGRVRVPQRLLLGLALFMVLASFLSFASAKDMANESITDPDKTFVMRGTCFNEAGVQYPCHWATESGCTSGASRLRAPLNLALFNVLSSLALFWGPVRAEQTLGGRNDSAWSKIETDLPSTHYTGLPTTTDMTCIMSGMNATVSSQSTAVSTTGYSTKPAIIASTASGEVASHAQTQLPTAITTSDTSMVCVYGSGWPGESVGATMNCSSTASSPSLQTVSPSTSLINGAGASVPHNLCSDGSGLLLPCPSSAAERKSPQLGATGLHLSFYVGLTLIMVVAARVLLQ